MYSAWPRACKAPPNQRCMVCTEAEWCSANDAACMTCAATSKASACGAAPIMAKRTTPKAKQAYISFFAPQRLNKGAW